MYLKVPKFLPQTCDRKKEQKELDGCRGLLCHLKKLRRGSKSQRTFRDEFQPRVLWMKKDSHTKRFHFLWAYNPPTTSQNFSKHSTRCQHLGSKCSNVRANRVHFHFKNPHLDNRMYTLPGFGTVHFNICYNIKSTSSLRKKPASGSPEGHKK